MKPFYEGAVKVPNEVYRLLNMICKLLGHRFESSGIEHGFVSKNGYLIWFCDNGCIDIDLLEDDLE